MTADIDSLLDSLDTVAQEFDDVSMEPVETTDTDTSTGTDPRLYYLSYSSLLDLHNCPRKFQLNKLARSMAAADDPSSSVTFAYGHLVGAGVQSLLLGRSMEETVWECFLNWEADLLGENPWQNKDVWEALYCLQVFAGMYAGGFLSDYEVALVNGVPASELSFRITFPNGYKYRGYVDLVLRHIITGEYLVLEIKTTSAKYVKEESYRNSAQAIGYSIVLDRLFGDMSSYKVLYLPYLTGSRKFEPMEFTKLFSQRARWITELILDTSVADMYIEHNLFPMHGESCLSFGRPCNYYQNCTMDDKYLLSAYDASNDPELEPYLHS